MKLAIGIPTCGTIKSQTAFALFRMVHHLPFEYNIIFKEGSILHHNREMIVKEAIRLECTHLLFLDSDMFFEADAVIKLIERNKDIIGVHYCLRKLPPTTTVKIDPERWAKVKEEHPDGLLTCDAVGTGFVLINLDVFKKITEPWFFWKSDENGEIVEGEDAWFCRKAREAGYEIWVDLTVPMKHLGEYMY